jgi:hypothetical protein
MLRPVSYLFAAVLVMATALPFSATAGTISYNETFQNTFGSTSSTFTGSASPNPVWTVGGIGTNTAAVTSAGTLTLDTTSKQLATVSAAGLLGAGATAFDVSGSPLTVTATLAVSGNGDPTWRDGNPAGWISGGLAIGGLVFEAFPDYGYDTHPLGQYVRITNQTGTLSSTFTSGYAVAPGTPFTMSATLSALDSSNYTLDYSIGGVAQSPLTVAMSDIGALDSVGVFVVDVKGGTALVTSFSVSQVPEPSAMALCFGAAAALAAYGWRKRR